MLHELSIERNRLKHEQTKLERLSAGLMIDLQSTLITSDDHVVVSAPEGMHRSDSDLSLAARDKIQNSARDDIDVSTRSRTVLTKDSHDGEQLHRQIRTAKSHSPGRNNSNIGGTTTSRKSPPSPPYGQVTPGAIPSSWYQSAPPPICSTPTRVNFRTGLSGHRALTSSHSHPHDFIGDRQATIRSMSNHAGAGISYTKSKPANVHSRGRSLY